jgi:hypothetical protein
MQNLAKAACLAMAGLGAASCQHAPFLVRDGVPTATIVVAAEASADEKLASVELQDYLRKMSGAELPVGNAPADDGDAVVRVGVFGSAAVESFRGRRPPSDGFALQTEGRTLYVVGGDARGTLYGAYELLERLGVRWFMPTELGEDVPVARTVPLPELAVLQGPAFRHVSGLVWAGGPGAAAWERRLKGRVGPDERFGHNWSAVLRFTPENVKLHRELFAEVGGKRGESPQLCSAHPEVVRLSVEAARRFFDANTQAEIFSLSPNDGFGFCEDERCRAVDALYGVTDGTLSDRFVHYANEVLAELEKTHPGKQIGILAYVFHTNPPLHARPHQDYATLITHTPWDFCHVHAIGDPACSVNPRFASYLRGWSAAASHVGVYDYYGHFFVFAPWPILHSIRRDIPFLHALGIERFTSETQQNWANQGLNFYVAAKLLWDPATDVDALLREYYTRFYGRAAPAMQRYWERWEAAMTASAAQGDGGYEWLRMFTPELVAECEELLEDAERLAGGDTDKVQRRVAFARVGLGFTQAFMRMLDAGARRDLPALRTAAAEAELRLQEARGSEPQAFFTTLALDQTRALLKILEQGVPPWVALRP